MRDSLGERLAAQQAQVALPVIERKCQRGAGIEYRRAAIGQLHHSWRIAAAHITARQQQRMRSGRDHQHHGRSRCQQPRQATARCDRPQPLAVGGQLGQRGQHLGPSSVQPLPEGLLLAPGQRMARIGLQPALQGALLAFRQRACTAPYHPAQRLPGLTRRGFGRGHGCGLPHREWVRFPVVTTAGTICPRQSPLIGPFPAAVAGSAALRAAHACRPGSWRSPGARQSRVRSGPGSG